MLSRFGFEKKAIAVFLAGLLALGGVVSLGQGASAALPNCTTSVSDLFDTDNDGFLEINDAGELIKFSISQEVYRNSDVLIRSNIDISNCDWLPIDDFAGEFDGGEKEISFTTTRTSPKGYSGLFGSVVLGQVLNLKVAGSISVLDNTSYVGGLAGYLEGTADNVRASVSISLLSGKSSSYVGGLAGYAFDSVIINSSSSGDVSGDSEVGGLVGLLSRSSVHRSWAAGSVEAKLFLAGGLIGESQDSQISESYATGAVNSPESIGGLVGSFRTFVGRVSSIVDSFAIGTVSGTNSLLGGLVGKSQDLGNGAKISNSYYAGTLLQEGVFADGSSGLLAGESTSAGTYLSRTVARQHIGNSLGVDRASMLVGKGTVTSEDISTRTTEEMRNQSFFKDTLNWDFTNTWTMSPASSEFQGFPILQWQVIDSDSGGGSGGSGGSGSFAGLNPTVSSSKLFANLQVRRTVSLSGAHLNMVVSAQIGSKKALIDFRRSTASNLEISRLPLLPSGQYQLRLLGAAGQLVAEVPITIKAKFKNVRGFGSSAELSADLRKAIRKAARTYPAANSVRCRGVTTGTSASDLDAARQRAEAACEYLASRDPDLETQVRVRSGKGKPAANQAVRLRFFK